VCVSFALHFFVEVRFMNVVVIMLCFFLLSIEQEVCFVGESSRLLVVCIGYGAVVRLWVIDGQQKKT
jgi:hypothetical protein